MKKSLHSILKKYTRPRFIFLSVAACAGLFILSALISKTEAAPASSIRLDPTTDTVAKDQTFSLDAKINPGTNQVTAVEVHITYDAAKFQMTGISASSVFSSVLQAGQYDNAAGTASIIVGVPASNPPSPIITDSTVAAFTLKAIGQSGTSPIAFTTETKAAALGETGDVIITRTPAQITIGRTFGTADFAVLASDWLQTKTSAADVNNDGKVNSEDLGIMMSSWQ
jgi:hypothetical protein